MQPPVPPAPAPRGSGPRPAPVHARASAPAHALVPRALRTLPAARRAGLERRAEPEDGLTPELLATVTGARRRALRDGDRQIDTAHLLHSLVEADPEAAAAFDGDHRLARVLGYLVQRSIGYGLRWQRSVEDTGSALPVVRGASGNGADGWSPAAAAALAGAFERAARRGDRRARGLDLLAALTADPDSRAAEVLRRAGVDRAALAARIGEPSQQV